MLLRSLLVLNAIFQANSRTGVDPTETGHLPDEIADVEEMAEKADAKFHAASQRILRRVQRRTGKREPQKQLKPFDEMYERVDTNEFDRY